MTTSQLPSLIQGFFADRLLGVQGASQHTVFAYRDTFRLLLRFAAQLLRRSPSNLKLENIDASFLGRFLDYLEKDRGNLPRTRNLRLAALHAFFRYVALREPEFADQCQRVLAIPIKRYERKPVEFLNENESTALVAAPDPTTWIGRRDRTLLALAVQTGLRNGEITALQWQDVELGAGAHVRCLGKGRKRRSTPLTPEVAKLMASWFAERDANENGFVFPSTRGGNLSADALQRLVTRHTTSARKTCPSLANKNVTPHALRHTAAMNLLQHGVDLSVIALWLGHESTQTTEIYLHADMQMKEKALAHASPTGVAPTRYRPPDSLLAFLESL